MTNNDIEDMISSRIGNSNLMDISVSSFGNLVDVNILYEDGDTLPTMRRWIEDNIPNLWHLSIDRCYSQKTLSEHHLNEDDEQSIEYAHNRLFSVTLQ